MNDSTHENSERLSRQQAAEHVTDIAYALIMGGPLTFNGERQVTVPIADEIVLRRSGTANEDRIQLELQLSWSTAKQAS